MSYQPFRTITKLIFDQPFFYGARGILLGGWPFAQTLRLIDSKDSDVILDVGCGPGHFVDKIKFKNYLGFDHDPQYIQAALKRKIPNAVFTLDDIRNYDFQNIQPTKAILSGVLHHLSDPEAIRLLNALARTVSQWIVSEDPVYSKYHPLNNFLCRLDRGQFVRTEDEMSRLIAQTKLRVEKKILFYSNTRISKHIAFRLIPFLRPDNKASS